MNSTRCLLTALALLGVLLVTAPRPASAQPVPVPALKPTIPASPAAEKAVPASDTKSDSAPPEEPAPPKPVVDPELIRFELTDGSGISGKLSVKEITVETLYGALKIPVTEIKSFTPGLGSTPELAGKITHLIDDLGAEDYNQREAAHRDLLKFGPPVLAMLEKRVSDDNVERAKHLKAIIADLETLSEGNDDGEGGKPPRWINDDTVETVNFTVTGHISPQTFEMTSKFGKLNVALADIRRAHQLSGLKEDVQRAFSVEGQYVVGKSFKKSPIRVEKGDHVSVTADGSIVMTPWGNEATSTPDGGENYGWYMPAQIASGALVAKIGPSGLIFRVGSKHSFVADRAGILEFGIAIQPQQARSNFPGKYDLKVRVEPR